LSSLATAHARRRKTSRTKEAREAETEDSPERIDAVCEEFAECMLNSKCVVIYTGAGISTAANIPDYRGPEGIWTKLRDGRELGYGNAPPLHGYL
jgi:NAD-dependent deacetylase sirtuin 7